MTFPSFFLSGALFPIWNLPAWLSAITFVNPVTYRVDAIRGLMLGTYHFGLLVDSVVPVIFALVVVVIGTLSFR